ncbi:Uncharacterised protein [uncultured archaeon]|nr:Uncharacterised protein [uncultured archaeon]
MFVGIHCSALNSLVHINMVSGSRLETVAQSLCLCVLLEVLAIIKREAVESIHRGTKANNESDGTES